MNKHVFFSAFMMLLVFMVSCKDDDGFHISENDKTFTVLMKQIPDELLESKVYFDVFTAEGALYSTDMSTAENDKEVKLLVPSDDASFSVAAYIPDDQDWVASTEYGTGYFAGIEDIDSEIDYCVITAWNTSADYEGISPAMEVAVSSSVDDSYYIGEIIHLAASTTLNIEDDEVATVEFYLNDEKIKTFSMLPFALDVNTLDLDYGDYTFKVVATTESGLVFEAEDEFEYLEYDWGLDYAPVAYISNLENYSVLQIGDNVSIEVALSEETYIYDNIMVYIDGKWHYTYKYDEGDFECVWETEDVEEGYHEIEVVITGISGEKRNDIINVWFFDPEDILTEE